MDPEKQGTGATPADDLNTRIENAFDEAILNRKLMLEAQWEVQLKETNAKVEHPDEWAAAKNGEVRSMLLADWLRDDAEYWSRREDHNTARNLYRIGLLEVERLKLLVEARKAAA